MPSTGTQIAQDLKDSFNNVVSAPAKAVSDTVDTVKKFFTNTPVGQKANPDTSWHDSMVKAANDSFKPKPSPPTPTVKKPALPSYKEGTDNVPHTGPALLHKGEAVLKKEDADKLRNVKEKTMSKEKESVMKEAASSLAGKHEETPKKEIKHIKTEKAKNGGYIHTHSHTHPEHHPDEQHISKDQDAMASHMLQHMGEPNPGEAGADAGQSGIPDASAGAAPAGAPATGAAQPVPGM